MVAPTSVSPRSGGPQKRPRPPKLALKPDGLRRPSNALTVVTSALHSANGDSEESEERFSSPSSSLSGSPVEIAYNLDSDSDADQDLSKGLEILEKLRKNVHNNLRLRPLRSATFAPEAYNGQSSTAAANFPRPSAPPHRSDSPPSTADSSASSPALSMYFTPTTDIRFSPLSARHPAFEQTSHMRSNANTPRSASRPRSRSPGSSRSPSPIPPPRGIETDVLFAHLDATFRPLLIDTRQTASHLSSRVQHSISISIPPLIMRRCTKPGGRLPSLESLQSYITTPEGRDTWDELMKPGGRWDGDIVVLDEEMHESDRNNPQVLSWAIFQILQPLVGKGSVCYLKGGIAALRLHPSSHQYMIMANAVQAAESRSTLPQSLNDNSPRSRGLFQLDTNKPALYKAMPEIEQQPASPEPCPNSSPHNMLYELSPSPSPSSLVFPRLPKARKKSSHPNLRKIDTSSAERLVPKLTLRTVPSKSNTLSAPLSRQSSATSLRPNSPSHLKLSHSHKCSNGPSRTSRAASDSSDSLSPIHATPPRSPLTPLAYPPSPSTARPELDQPPTTEEDPLPTFTVSTILPNFLFLGPEPALPEHAEELQSLGVKRILNIAIECDDDLGLNLRSKFERYTRIPMRDIVEEENVVRSVREACEVLDDARLHSAPTYVHCKAGKSRSVTAVIGYLIHANHWTLGRAYAFVTERRKGISPNIGFVSELMIFEEQELGGKSVGVINSSASSVNGGHDGEDHKSAKYGYATGRGRTAQLRESLPPILQTQSSDVVIPGQLSAGGLSSSTVSRVGDSGQEMEIKDAHGRYRHARRAPVDETTLQPMRRVSKAGLESTFHLSQES